MLDQSQRQARKSGFKQMRLKTATVLVEAISLYKRAGLTAVEGAEAGGNCDLVLHKVLK